MVQKYFQSFRLIATLLFFFQLIILKKERKVKEKRSEHLGQPLETLTLWDFKLKFGHLVRDDLDGTSAFQQRGRAAQPAHLPPGRRFVASPAVVV